MDQREQGPAPHRLLGVVLVRLRIAEYTSTPSPMYLHKAVRSGDRLGDASHGYTPMISRRSSGSSRDASAVERPDRRTAR